MLLITEICVRTGIYGWSLNLDKPSRKLYEDAIEITTKLKDKAREETLKKRIETRKAKQEKRAKKADKNNADGKGTSRGENQGLRHNGAAANGTAVRTRSRWFNRANEENHPSRAEQGEGGVQT